MKRFIYNLVEKTNGHHYGKVHRSEWMTPEDAAIRNEGMTVVRWERHENEDATDASADKATTTTGMTADERDWIG